MWNDVTCAWTAASKFIRASAKKSSVRNGVISLVAAGCTLIKKRRSPLTRLLSSISCGLWEETHARLLVGGVKTAAFQIDKSSQVLRIHVGDSPERESLAVPMQDIIAVFSKVFHGGVPPRCRRPDKQVNNMESALVDECCYLPTVEIIQTAAG